MHCVDNKTRLISFILASLLSLPLFAQGKKQAPATRFTLPVDTTAVDTSAAEKPADTQEKKIELPEVLIYGKDSSKRISGKKITISPDNTELVNPPVLYDPISVEEMDRGERKRLREGRQGREKHLQAHAWGGQFSQLGSGFSWWQDAGELDYSTELAFERTGGQYFNSNFDRFNGALELGYSGDRDNRWSVHGQINRLDYGLYGAAIPEYRRSYGWSELQVNGSTGFGESGTLEVTAGLLTGSLEDTLPDSALDMDYSFSLWQISGGLRQQVGAGELLVSGRVVSDALRKQIGSPEQDIRWQRWQAAYKTSLMRGKLQLRLGAVLTTLTEDTLSSSMLGPDLRAIFLHGSRLAVTLWGKREFSYTTWEERLRDNPYLAGSYRAGGEKFRYQGGLDIEWKLSDASTLTLRYSQSAIDNYRYFEADSSGRFSLRSADVKFKNIDILFSRSLTHHLDVEAGITFLDDAVRLTGVYDPSLDIPYRGEFILPVKLSWKPVSGLELNVDYLWIGSRVARLQPAEAIGAWSALNISAGYRLAEHINITLSGRNLLNETTALWQGYKTTGAHVRGGLSLQW